MVKHKGWRHREGSGRCRGGRSDITEEKVGGKTDCVMEKEVTRQVGEE